MGKMTTFIGFGWTMVLLILLPTKVMGLADTPILSYDTNGTIHTVISTPTTVYIGGSFSEFAGQPRSDLAALDVQTGALLDWAPEVREYNPFAYHAVFDMVLSGSKLFIGGSFSVVDNQYRKNLAAVDAVTGTLLPWNPGMYGSEVDALAISDTSVFIGGIFWYVGGQSRSNLAEVDIETGAATSWNPGADDRVRALLLSDSTLYVGGRFSQLDGETRNCLGAFGLETGKLKPWNPDMNYTVCSLAAYGSNIYAGGYFTFVGGEPRNHIAAIDIKSGFPTAWNPDAQLLHPLAHDYGQVYKTLVYGTDLIVGGEFDHIGEQERFGLASFDLTANTNNATSWHPPIENWTTPYDPDVLTATAVGHSLIANAFDGYSIVDMFSTLLVFQDRSYRLTLNINPANSGSVLTDPLQEFLYYTSDITLTANPRRGFKFLGWTGDLVSVSNPAPLVMDSHKSVTANFERLARAIYVEGDLDFGTILMGTTVKRTLTIYSDGTLPLNVDSIDYPEGFSGDWSGQIPSGGSQTIDVTFAPVRPGVHGGTVSVNADDIGGTSTVPASGTANSRYIRLVGNWNFDNVPVNTVRQGTLTIWNDGNLPLTVTSISYPSAFSGIWSGEIAPGASETVTIQFLPTGLQTYNGTITVACDKTHGENAIAVSGSGVMPSTRIVRLAGDLAFGATTVNTTVERTLTIYNDGNAALTVTGIACPSRFSGDWSGQIEPGKSKAVTMTFTPDEVKAYSGTVTVNCNSTSGTKTIAVSGSGTAQGVREIRLAGSLDCRSVLVGTTVQRALIIYNDGTSPLTVNSISLPEGYSGAWTGVVTPGTFHAVPVLFSPTAVKVYEGNISVSSDKTSGTSDIFITGRGTNETTRVIRLAGDLAFGHCQAHTETERTLTIHNDGSSVLTVDSIQSPTPFYGGWVGQIPSGESKDVTITFIPDEDQEYSKTLRVISNATSGPGTIIVSGTSKPQSRIIRLAGDLAFGPVTVNTTTQRTLTIHNDGNVPMMVNSISYPNGFSGAWAGEIAAGGSQDVTVTFAPTVVQSYSGNVAVNCNSTTGTASCAISGMGAAVATEATATISNAWWSEQIDIDGDGYKSSMKLWCKPDVAGGSGSLTVSEKIYYRASGQQPWTLCAQTNAHTINGTSAGNIIGLTLQAKAHGTYDYRIEVYRNGQSAADHTIGASTSTALSAYQEELSSEDKMPDPQGPCFIATAAYGTSVADDLNVLRTLRDDWLLDCPLGSAFVDTYYRVSPPLADIIAQRPLLAASVRVALVPVVALAKMLLIAPYLTLLVLVGTALPVLARLHWRRRHAALRAQYLP